ncbi:MAG: B12-binding domain-containing radical SAM protein [Promethearchaeota archaeon]
MTKTTILFLKSLSPILYSTENFALKIRDDPKYDNNPLINKKAIDEAFKQYEDQLNPSNRTYIGNIRDYNINVEGYFLAAHLPEIPSIVINRTCTVELLHELLEKYDDITHIALTVYAMGMENSLEVIKTIKKDYTHIELLVGGVGTLYPHIQELIPQKDLCVGEGVNWLRKRFNLPQLSRNDFIIPEIIKNLIGFPIPIKAAYMITQLGCPNSCDFCITHIFYKYCPFSNPNKIIHFIDNLYNNTSKDIFIYICDPNAFYPEGTWRKVFDYFINNHKKYERNIFILCLASLHHLSKFNLKKIQDSPLKLLFVNFGIESDIYSYSKNIGNPKGMVKLLNELNIITYHTFIIGFPFHTPDGIKREVSLNLKYDSDRFFLNSYKPIPNTILYNQLKAEERLLIKDLPPEFIFTYEYMPFRHRYLGFGFDILKYCFYTYCETEKKEIDNTGKYTEKILNLFEHTNSNKLKRIASAFMNVSNANFLTFKERMPEDLIEKYQYQTNLNIEKFKKLKIKKKYY